MSTSTAPTDPLETFGLPKPLILGSGSFTRKLILKEMNVAFQTLVRPIDERSLGDRSRDRPHDLVLTLAKAKASHLVNEIESGRCKDDLKKLGALSDEYLVLTGDQVVTHRDEILEKPLDEQEARSFVSRYADSPPSTVGSCVLTHIPTNTVVSGVDTATIHFRPTVAEGDLVGRLLEDGAPVLSCAGGLMVEHPLVKEHIERIDGTVDSVMGLSKDLVLRLMEELSTKLRKN